MSGSFVGFSEDDIKKLKNTSHTKHDILENEIKDTSTVKTNMNVKKISMKTQSKVNQNKNIQLLFTKETSTDVGQIPTEAKLPEISIDVQSNIPEKDIEQTFKSDSKQNTTLKSMEYGSQRKPVDLNEFQMKHKFMEEQNRLRKEMLSKILADRTKQTQEETQRLNEIQQEFRRLDAVLSTDVKILRYQIEMASLEYMEAQKKYEKIEKEFVRAKENLQIKMEKKEMLTEHLCTIIEKNEERKAEKLKELLNKLENRVSFNSDTKSIINSEIEIKGSEQL